MESQEQARMQSIIDSYLKSALGYYRVEGFLYALPQVLGVILICIVSIGAHEKNFLAPGALLSYIYLLVRCLQGFSVIFSMGSNFLLRIPQIREIYRWWSFSELPITQEIRPNFNAKKDLSLQIESPIGWHLKDLTFSYPLGSPLFSPINCEIKPASALVITGASGAGKTTLLNLLIGELSPTNGKIALTINGDKLPLSEVRPTILRTLGYVGPEPFIVPGTILQNLMYGLEAEASTEAIKEAVTLAKCDFIGALPRGLHHVISEQGEGLSAGQKQRLMLARALLRNPKALILDEPTANLDPEAENFLVHTFSILKKRMTLLIVTHRTAFLPLADKLIDLSQNPKQGELV